jgi:hypothetical protein
MANQTHVIKIPLLVEEWEKGEIKARMHAHGTLYNAVLIEYLNRIDKYHANPISQLKNSKTNTQKKNNLKKSLGLSKFDVQKMAHKIANGSKNSLYDGLTTNETAARAHRACQKYLKTGKSKPGTKNPYHNNTVMGSGIRQNLRLVVRQGDSSMAKYDIKYTTLNKRDNVDDIKDLFLSWTGRKARQKLLLLIDWYAISQIRREYILDNLNKLAQAGITKELIRGEWKYYCLLVINAPAYRNLQAEAKLKQKTGKSLGLDTGPMQSHGVNSDNQTILVTPSKEQLGKYREIEKKIKSKQRRLDRSRRNNPAYQDNYNPDGTINKGVKFDANLQSKNAKRLGNDIYELNRKRVAVRDELIRQEVKELVSHYDTIIVEKIRYSTWQSRYGKSMLLHTPGRYQQLLQAELERHDKELVQLPLSYAFSQACVCGIRVKKKLSNRVHQCDNKTCPLYQQEYHRDQFSAFLMLKCTEYSLTPNALHSGKLLKLLVSKISNNQGTTIETLLPPTLDQAKLNKSSRLMKTMDENLDSCKDAVIHDKPLPSANLTPAIIYHK